MGGDPDLSYLYFGDGDREFVEEQPNVMRYDLDPTGAVAEARYVTVHTYSSMGSYKITYTEPNRNGGVLNMDNSLNTFFNIETSIALSQDFVATPNLLTPPLLLGISGESFEASIAAVDEADYTLFYVLSTPGNGAGPVINYKLPENFKLNTVNGHISWDTKFNGSFQQGEYNFAAKIKQFKGEQLVSTMVYDFQIILNEGTTGRKISGNKTVDENARIYVPLNSTSKFKVFVEDAQSNVDVEVFSELLDEDNGGSVSFSTYDSTHNGKSIKVGVIEVTNSEHIVRDNPYPLVVRGLYSDNFVQGKDLTYLIYTKDVELDQEIAVDPEIVLSTGEETKLLDVYPNPVGGELHLKDERIIAFSIYSISGILLEGGAPSLDRTVDLHSLKPGFYVLMLNSGRNKGEVVKLIKQ
jgi:hypothetical protein